MFRASGGRRRLHRVHRVRCRPRQSAARLSPISADAGAERRPRCTGVMPGRKLLAFSAVVVLTELGLVGVTHLPVDPNPIGLRGVSLPTPPTPWRLGYGYEPPASDLLAWLSGHGAQFLPVPLQDSPAIASSRVDAVLRHDSDSISAYGVMVAYDPERQRSREVALAVGKLIDGYPGRISRAFVTPIGDEPLSFHVFFGILMPLLLLAACAMGVLAARSHRIRGRFGAGLALVAGLLVLVSVQVPYIDFPGNEA